MNDKKRAQLTGSFSRSKMMALYGAVVTGIEKGFFEITVAKQDFMSRPAGMFNGGVIATLVDTASGYAAVSTQENDSYFVTVELKVNYLNPAIGTHLIARATVVKNGKILTIVRTDIYAVHNDKEQLAATSLVTLMQIKHKA